MIFSLANLCYSWMSVLPVCDHFLCQPLWSHCKLSALLFVHTRQNLSGMFSFSWWLPCPHRGSHILFSWMIPAGCVFVAAIHLSRTWMSGYLESEPLCKFNYRISSFISVTYSKSSHAFEVFFVVVGLVSLFALKSLILYFEPFSTIAWESQNLWVVHRK